MKTRVFFLLIALSMAFSFFYFMWWNLINTDKTVWFILAGIVKYFPSSIVFVSAFVMPVAILYVLAGIVLLNREKLGIALTIILLGLIFFIDIIFMKFLNNANKDFDVIVSKLITDSVFVLFFILFLPRNGAIQK
ncbi:MAG: hypothetical protein KF862_13795 [Chitinophagaceae bacterium]|nr:hypothetical protein [Chitinophagaceae bacterium]